MTPQETADPARVRRWFERLYRQARGHMHVAYTGNWAGRTFDLAADGIEAAVKYVGKVDATVRPAGIYSRITTLRQPPDEDRRGGVTLTASLPALWADVCKRATLGLGFAETRDSPCHPLDSVEKE